MKNIRKQLLFFIVLIIILPQTSLANTNKRNIPKKHPTVALVLSGGGAKGFAHLGILNIIDSLDIPIDYIVGTSMGATVGALYATGYSAKDMIREIESHNWEEIFADKSSTKKTPINIKDENSRYAISFPIKGGIRLPQGIIKGQQMINLLSFYTLKYHNINDFSKLPIPFTCVAVNLETGEEVRLENGFLPQALRASMAIPTVFTPSKIDNKLLVDGGLINNFPVDIAREKGFDYIIGIDVQTPLRTKQKLRSVTDVLSQMVAFTGKPKNDKNIKLCDIYINPDLEGYNAGSFSKEEIDTILKKGKEAGEKAYPQLLKLKKILGNRGKKNIKSPFYKNINFNHVTVSGLKRIKNFDFIKKLNLKESKSIDTNKLNELIENVTASLNLDLLSFRLKEDTLQFIAHEKNNNRFNVGANYNNDNNANILLNITYYNELIKNSRLSADIIMGDILQFTGRYTQNFKSMATLNLCLDAKRYKPSLYEENRKIANGEISFIRFDANTQFMLWDSYSGGIGLREEYVATQNTISITSGVPNKSYDWYTSYYGFIRLNTLNNKDYPTEGLKFDGEIRYLSSNDNPKSGTIIYAELKKAYSLSKKLGIIMDLQGRTIINNKTGIIYQNRWGGLNEGKYLSNHIPFLGTRWIQGMNNAMATARIDFRYEMFPDNYLVASGNYGRYTNAIHKMLTANTTDLWGGAISFSYDSLIGPLSLTLMYSNAVKEPLIYINIGHKF